MKKKTTIILIVSVVLIIALTSVHYRHKVSVLKRELFDTKIKHALEIDSLKTAVIHEQIRLTDSILSVEQEKYEALLFQFKQTKKEYEKISSDYSGIVIDRPEY